MAWLQENWIIAVVGLVVAVILLWFLFGRKKPEEIEAPLAPPAAPKKPLEAVKPEIIAAEPARFKPKEPSPAPVAAPPSPAAAPLAEAPPAAAPKPEPAPEPAAKLPEEPTVPAEPAAETPKAEPKPKPARAAKPKRQPAAAIPEEPTVPAPAPKAAPKPAKRAAKPAASPEPAPAPAPPAPAAKADNLQLLKGVGPKMVALLNGLGVTSFQQIAGWTDADVAAIDPQLGAFQGRIARDAIVDQAGYLARGDKAGFEAKYGALGGEL